MNDLLPHDSMAAVFRELMAKQPEPLIETLIELVDRVRRAA